MSAVLSVRGLTVAAAGRGLVADLQFEIGEGERVALLGASGSGKSLTALALQGLLAPVFDCTGHIRLLQTPVRAGGGPRPRAVARKLVGIHQDSQSALNPLVRVGDQLAVPLGARRGTRSPAVVDLLRRVGLDESERIARGYPAELSGGQRQRVCIALALACRPRLLIADEPTTALDVVSQAEVVRVFDDVVAELGTALVFITHDLPVAAQLCDRALVLSRGRLVEDAPFAQLLEDPRHEFSARMVNEAVAREVIT